MTRSNIILSVLIPSVMLASCEHEPATTWIDPNPRFQNIRQNVTRIDIVSRTASEASGGCIESVVTVDDESEVRNFFESIVLKNFVADTITVTYCPAEPVIRPFLGGRPLDEFGIIGGDGGIRGKGFRGDVYFTRESSTAVAQFIERHRPTSKE